MIRNGRTILCCLLATVLMLPVSVFASVKANPDGRLADLAGHWAEESIHQWHDQQLVMGYGDGSFRPDQSISRVEFVILLNRIFQFIDTDPVNFTDIDASYPFRRELMKAIAEGYIDGYEDGSFRPNQPITRQEAAVMIAEAFRIQPSSEPVSKLSDVESLADWSKGAVRALVHTGYINGYPDGTFRGEKWMTRAEAVKLLSGISGPILKEPGLYENITTHNMVINASGVSLRGSTIEGNLILAEGIGEGSVKLDNVTVKGSTLVAGGGSNSVDVIDSSIGDIIVDNKLGVVRIVVDGDTRIDRVFVLSGVSLVTAPTTPPSNSPTTEPDSDWAIIGPIIVSEEMLESAVVELIGRFGEVIVRSPSEPEIRLLQGIIEQLVLERKAHIHVEEDGEIVDLMNHTTEHITVTGSGKVTVNPDSKGEITLDSGSGSPSGSGSGTRGSGSNSGKNPGRDPGTDPGTDPDTEVPEFANVSVHDPSIIKADGMYYVFGTHIEAAKSEDLMRWTRFTNGYTTPGNALYGDLSTNLAESFAWAGENDSDSLGGFAVWAPEIIWAEDYVNEDGTTGAYLIYYSASSTYIRSAIGIAASKNIEGPYEYVDTIVYSGFTREEAYDENSTINKKWTNTHLPKLIEDGAVSSMNPDWFNDNGTYRNSVFPNAIDANLFHDENGRLWMSYGSWSGGIFLLEIDKTSGRPIYPGENGVTDDGRLIDRYFGIKIAGGHGKSGEGPYIVYDADSGYYFLYITYGWLESDGGYNMRVFRAEAPEGPYLDAQGQDAVLPDSGDHSPYGMKLMSNYWFARNFGDPGSGDGIGYAAPGHNSVYWDEEAEEHLLVFHTRFPGQGEYHEVRVHQLFMNKNGWPIAAPYRYTGEQLTSVTEDEIVGEYKFINHGKAISGEVEHSVYIRLLADHMITGDVHGSWRKTGDYDAEITIDGITYDGVFVKQWDPVSEQHVMTFTAMSEQGVAIWGSRISELRSDEEIVEDVVNDLSLGDTTGLTGNLTLPEEGSQHASIDWTSSDESVISSEGIVVRPEADAGPATAELTATVTKGTAIGTKTFTITVLPRQRAELLAHYAFEEDLSDASGNFDAGSMTGDRIHNTGGTITFADGVQGKAAVFDGRSGVRLPDGLIEGHNYSVSLWVKPELLTPYTTTFFGARDDTHWISMLPQGPAGNQTMLWSGSEPWYDAPSGMTIPTDEWAHLAFTVEKGTVKLYVNGEETFSGTNFPHVFTSDDGWFSLGVNWWDTPYQGMIDELRIYEGILAEGEITALAFDPSVLVEEIRLSFADKRLSLGSTFTPGSVSVWPAYAGNQDVVWSSADPTVATVDPNSGTVTAVGVGQTTITATASDDSGVTASYPIFVSDGAIAYYPFDGNLSDGAGFSEARVTGDRADNTGGTITFEEGVNGLAAVFDGSSGIRLPDGLISGDHYSVTMSVYLETDSQYTTTFFGARDPDSWISFVPRGSGEHMPTVLWSGTNWYDADTNMQIPLGVWTDVAFTVDQGDVTVYIDGEPKYEGKEFPDVFTTNNGVFTLGVNYWDPPFRGKIDELRIFDRALTREQLGEY